MFVDALLLLSDAQVLTATDDSTNVIDLGNTTPVRDISAGEPMALAVNVDAAADAVTGDETYEIAVVQSDNADLSSPDVLTSRVILAAQLGIGTVHQLPIPPGSITKRYLGATYTLGGTTPGLTLTAYIGPMNLIESRRNYAASYSA
jgi:hypothetical protein